MTIDRDVTVIVTTSPIPSHPATHVIDDTLASVAHHLPDAETIIAADGVVPELAARTADYHEALRRITHAANMAGHRLPVIADGHIHQAAAVVDALAYVTTPLVLMVEHDTPLVAEPIDWGGIADSIRCGAVNHVRFSHEAAILPEHRYLMLDSAPRRIGGVPLVRTVQYSQRPALTATAFMRTMLAAWCGGPPTYIEDRVYGVVLAAWAEHGIAGWEQFRLAVYHPDGDSIQRSTHSDGRGTDPKVET